MKFYKLIFFNTMIMGTIISISSYSWFSMWMGLEINLLSIIPIFSSQNSTYSSESSLKYFITQAIASLILLMSIIMMLMMQEFTNPQVNFYFSMMMDSAILTKLGAAPFHFWFPEVMEGLSWFNCMILLTWQKIAPMVLLMINKINSMFMLTVIIISLVVSTTMALNQMSLRKILTFSSINHIAWMLSSTLVSFSIWLIYFIIYSLITINIIFTFKMTNSSYLNQMNSILNKNKSSKIMLMLNFMSLGGLPPFIGFLPKWLLINSLISNKMFLLTISLILMTLIMMFVYIRMIFSSMTISLVENKLSSNEIKNFPMMTMNISSLASLIACTLMFNFF